MPYIEHEYTSEIVCPYCGHRDRNSWEKSGNDEEEMETECERCGREFFYYRHMIVEYSTLKKDENEA